MRNQSGFTLIELVVVIVILGVLAAVAVPKFIDIQGDARRSTLKGMEGALNSAAALAHAQQLAKNQASNAAIDLPGANDPQMVNGYPTAAANGIGYMIDQDGFTIAGGNPILFQLDASPDPTNCYASYTQSGDGSFPATDIESSGCD